MTIQVVFFDLGGTIETISYDDELRLAATAQLRQQLLDRGLDPGLTPEELYQVTKKGLLRYNAWKEVSLVELESPRIWQEYIFASLKLPPGKLAAAAEELSFFFETRFYRREMRPEVPAVLEAIREMGLKVGVISNVMSRGLVPYSLQQYGIASYFDPVVLSSVYGRRKPDPAIFHHAASLAGVPTGACAYVGDRLDRDIAGARRAGYRLAVQIRHDFAEDESDETAVPDAVLDTMTELVPILQKELRRMRSAAVARNNDRQVRAILFDAGDVLYFRPHKGRQFRAFLAELGLKLPGDYRAKTQTLKALAFQGQISQDEYLERLLKVCGIQEPEQIQCGKRILKEEGNNVHFFDGVRDTLTALKERGFLLGIVTDTAHPIHVKLGWFEQAGIGHVWDAIISSCDLGVRKPDPRIYHAALRQLGVQPEEAIFVGHKASELDGAKAVGMKTVAFNHDDGVQADVYIEHFTDLLKLPLISQNLNQ